jgi:antitoxin component YwqK of YwqJK toxin-antitoxin module
VLLLLTASSCTGSKRSIYAHAPFTPFDGYIELQGMIALHRTDGEVINFTDSQGQKQGRWIEEFPRNCPFPENAAAPHYIPVSRSMNYVNGILNGGYAEYEKYREEPILTGHYRLGKKNGEWKYHLFGKEIVEVYRWGVLVASR